MSSAVKVVFEAGAAVSVNCHAWMSVVAVTREWLCVCMCAGLGIGYTLFVHFRILGLMVCCVSSNSWRVKVFMIRSFCSLDGATLH